jgi:hypothetical protein
MIRETRPSRAVDAHHDGARWGGMALGPRVPSSGEPRGRRGRDCAEQLNLPLRERNRLLLAAGYTPAYAETALDAPHMAAVRAAVPSAWRARALPGRGRGPRLEPHRREHQRRAVHRRRRRAVIEDAPADVAPQMSNTNVALCADQGLLPGMRKRGAGGAISLGRGVGRCGRG